MAGRYYTLTLISLIVLAAWAGGIKFLYVRTGSMSPSLWKGDLVLVIPVRRLKVGDIISYEQNGGYITHRIVGIKDNLFVMKGDDNRDTDPFPVSWSEIAGKAVFSLPTHHVIKPSSLPLLYWIAGFATGLLIHRFTVPKVVGV